MFNEFCVVNKPNLNFESIIVDLEKSIAHVKLKGNDKIYYRPLHKFRNYVNFREFKLKNRWCLGYFKE